MKQSRAVLINFCKITIVIFISAFFINLNPTDSVHAATIEVDTTDDENNTDGDCSLREAIQAANTNSAVDNCIAGGASDVIVIPAGTYNLTTALTINTNVTLSGSGARNTILDGGSSTRIIDIGSGIVNIQDLTLTNGSVSDFGQGAGIQITGGTVTLESMAVTQSGGNGVLGGGIHVTSGATLIINHSSLSGNFAPDGVGGGIYSDGTLRINNSTISGNSASGSFGDGGGIAVGFGAPATIRNTTFSGNIGSGGNPGGVSVSGSLDIQNSIITNSTGDDCGDGFGTGTVNGSNNLLDDSVCGFVANPVTNFDTTLQNNGGPTDSHALSAGSNAIDNGSGSCQDHTPTTLTADQRGAARNSTCDIGAYEYRGSTTQCDSGSLDVGVPAVIEGVTFNFNSFGSADCITVERMGADHRAATSGSGGSGIDTGDWWFITADNTGFDVNLTFPIAGGNTDPQACRYPGSLGGYGWDCARSSFVSGVSVTRNNVTQFSDWAVGQQVSPTSITLQAVESATTNPIMWVLVGLLLVLLSGGLVLRHRQR